MRRADTSNAPERCPIGGERVTGYQRVAKAERALARAIELVDLLADDMERNGVESPPGSDKGTEPSTYAALLRRAVRGYR